MISIDVNHEISELDSDEFKGTVGDAIISALNETKENSGAIKKAIWCYVRLIRSASADKTTVELDEKTLSMIIEHIFDFFPFKVSCVLADYLENLK